LVDAAAALEHLTGEPALATLGGAHRYHKRVFITPPWPEIYVEDAERRRRRGTRAPGRGVRIAELRASDEAEPHARCAPSP
jgi:predicted ATPase